MKALLYILLVVVGVVVIGHLLATAVGLLVQIAVGAAILGCLVALVHYWIQKHQERKQPLRKHARASKAADRALKEMERTINKQ